MAIIKKGEAEVIFMMNESNLLVGNKEIHLLTAHVSKLINLTNLTFPFNQIPGLTDNTIPRRLGPKRASKIRFVCMIMSEYQDVLIMALL